MDVIHNRYKYFIILFIVCAVSVVYLNCEKSDYKIKIISIDNTDMFDLEDEFYVYFGRPSCPVNNLPALIKIKNGKCMEREDLSRFV